MITLFKKKEIIAPAEPNEVFGTCTELSMYRFVKCGLTGDLTHLVKSGQPDNLDEVWDKIQSEYADLSKDTSQSYLLSLMIQIDFLDKRLIHVQIIVDQLSVRRSEALIDILRNDMLFPFEYIDLGIDLNKTITKAKFDLMTLRKLEAEYKAFVEENKNVKETSEQDYEEQFIMLSKWMGAKYTLKETSVAEYIALINRFNAENKPKK